MRKITARARYRASESSSKGMIKYAVGKKNKRIGFITDLSVDSSRGRKRFVEEPSPEFRRVIAQHIDEIEDRLGTKLLRTTEGYIHGALGSGSWGVVFRLANGNVLKVSKDPTEGGSALFWKESQEKNPKLLNGSAKVYNVFSVKKVNKKFKNGRRYYYFIEREEIDPTSYVPSPVRQYLNKFVDEFHMFCSSGSKNYRHVYLNRAKTAIEQLRRHSPGLARVLCYGWDKGLPLIDAMESNVGVRIKKGIGKQAKRGQWVIFDFGGLSQDCFNLMVKNSKGRKTDVKGVLKSYCKKVHVLK